MKTIFITIALILTPSLLLADGIEDALSPYIPNFHYVSPSIYRGARPPDSDAVATMAQVGIDIDVDLQGGDRDIPAIGPLVPLLEPGELQANIDAEKNTAVQSGMSFFNLPLNSVDAVSNSERQEIRQVLQIISNAAHDQTPVFVHCEQGKDRTGLVIALYRFFYEHMDATDAHNEMLKYGHGDWSNLIITHAMDDYYWQAVGSGQL